MRTMEESKLDKVKQSLEDSLKNQHCGFIDGVGDVYAVSEETIKDVLELLKEQQEKIEKARLWLKADGVDLDAMCEKLN